MAAKIRKTKNNKRIKTAVKKTVCIANSKDRETRDALQKVRL